MGFHHFELRTTDVDAARRFFTTRADARRTAYSHDPQGAAFTVLEAPSFPHT